MIHLLRKFNTIVFAALLLAAASCNSGTAHDDKKEGDSDSAAAQASAPAQIPAGMKAEKSAKGFSIAVPDKWEIQRNYEGTDLMVFSPVSGADDNFKENYSVIVTDAMNYKLPDFYTANVQVFSTSAPGFKKVKESESAINGLTAKSLEYEFTTEGVTVHGMQYYMIKNNKAAIVTYSGSPEGFNDHLETFNTALKTFTLD